MALGQIKQKPSVFLSFAGEDVEWKRTLMQPNWWASLTKVAEIHDYADNPARSGDLAARMDEAINASSAFIALISKYYIAKDGVVEREFRTAVERYKAPQAQKLFLAIVIDAEGKEWWDRQDNELFRRHEWLRTKVYWPLIEGRDPALLRGDLQPHYARKVRGYAEDLAKEIEATPIAAPEEKPSAERGRIIILGRPTAQAAPDAAADSAIARARDALVGELRNRRADVSEWGDGWARASADKQEVCARELSGGTKAIIRPVGPGDAFDAALSPEVTLNLLKFIAAKGAPDVSQIKTSLWLPAEHRDHPDAKVFVDKAAGQAADTNPMLCVAAALELADRLAPLGTMSKITQISVEELDDIEQIENGPTARKLVEDELRATLIKGAQLAKLEIEPPLVRQFLNYQKLANQISEAKGGRIMLVAHDLQEHRADSSAAAHKILQRKVRNLKESVEGLVDLSRGQIIPITLVVTNYDHLKNDHVLDEEIAGIKWWLLPGQVSNGRFSPVEDIYQHVVRNVSKMLRGSGAGL
jgi:hypothetical protein